MPAAAAPLLPRQRALLVTYAAILIALVAAYAVWAPPSSIDEPVTFTALAVLGIVAIRCEVSLPARLALGSLPGVSLVTVALFGPIPALLVLAVALVAPAAAGQERLVRAGNLCNAASHAAFVLTASLTLDALGHGPLGLAVAAAVQLATNWLVGPALFATQWLGMPFGAVVAVGLRGVPSAVVVGALACAAVWLTPLIGLWALALFALVVIAPQATLALLARRGHASRLDRPELCRRYARALALELDLTRPERDRVDAVADLIRTRRPTGAAVDFIVSTLTDRTAEACDAGHLTEWVDGTGGPAGLSGGMIPAAARVVAVADAWAGLTAAGTQELSHAEAVELLRAEAGSRLDAEIVDHAARLALGLPPAAEPGLHPRWLPTAVRRRLLPGVDGHPSAAPAGAPSAAAT